MLTRPYCPVRAVTRHHGERGYSPTACGAATCSCCCHWRGEAWAGLSVRRERGTAEKDEKNGVFHNSDRP